MLNTKYFVTRNGVQINPEAFGNAWFVDEVQFVDTPDEESEALNVLDLRRQAVADKRFEPVLSGAGNASENDNIQLTEYAPNNLNYAADIQSPRVAVFSEIYYPNGWHLFCDGEELPLGRANYTLRAALLPAGRHHLQMSFIPPALQTDKWCLAIFFLTLLISLATILYPLYRNRLCRSTSKNC
jgi:hypothetical protein